MRVELGGFGKFFERFRIVASSDEGESEGMMQELNVRANPGGFAVFRQCFCVAPQAVEGAGEVVMSLITVGFETRGGAILFGGFGEAALLFQSNAEVVAGNVVVGRHGECVLKKRDAILPMTKLVFHGDDTGGEDENGNTCEQGIGDFAALRQVARAKSNDDKNADGG